MPCNKIIVFFIHNILKPWCHIGPDMYRPLSWHFCSFTCEICRQNQGIIIIFCHPWYSGLGEYIATTFILLNHWSTRYMKKKRERERAKLLYNNSIPETSHRDSTILSGRLFWERRGEFSMYKSRTWRACTVNSQ